MYEDNETLKDLNDLKLWDNDRSGYRSLKDYSTLSEEGSIEVVFRHLEMRLIRRVVRHARCVSLSFNGAALSRFRALS